MSNILILYIQYTYEHNNKQIRGSWVTTVIFYFFFCLKFINSKILVNNKSFIASFSLKFNPEHFHKM